MDILEFKIDKENILKANNKKDNSKLLKDDIVTHIDEEDMKERQNEQYNFNEKLDEFPFDFDQPKQ